MGATAFRLIPLEFYTRIATRLRNTTAPWAYWVQTDAGEGEKGADTILWGPGSKSLGGGLAGLRRSGATLTIRYGSFHQMNTCLPRMCTSVQMVMADVLVASHSQFSTELWVEVTEEWVEVTEEWVEVTEEVAPFGYSTLHEWVEVTEEWVEVTEEWVEVTEEWVEVTEEVAPFGYKSYIRWSDRRAGGHPHAMHRWDSSAISEGAGTNLLRHPLRRARRRPPSQQLSEAGAGGALPAAVERGGGPPRA
eukprot:gene31565-38187_t